MSLRGETSGWEVGGALGHELGEHGRRGLCLHKGLRERFDGRALRGGGGLTASALPASTAAMGGGAVVPRLGVGGVGGAKEGGGAARGALLDARLVGADR